MPVGRLTLGHGLTVTCGEGLQSEPKDEDGLFLFSIRDSAHRVMFCAVHDEAARDEWVRVLQAAAQKNLDSDCVAELTHEDESRHVEHTAGGDDRDDAEYLRAWFYPELPWGAPPSWQLLGKPETKWLLPWDILTSMACIYVGLKVPYTRFLEHSFPFT